MPMPKQLQLRDAYCSAPPLRTSTLRPPRLSRDEESRRPRAPLRPVKREVRESSEVDSVKYFIDDSDAEVKPAVRPVKEEAGGIRVGLAAISLRPPPSSASTSSEEAACRIMIMIDTIEKNLGAEAIGLYANLIEFTLPFAEVIVLFSPSTPLSPLP